MGISLQTILLSFGPSIPGYFPSGSEASLSGPAAGPPFLPDGCGVLLLLQTRTLQAPSTKFPAFATRIPGFARSTVPEIP